MRYLFLIMLLYVTKVNAQEDACEKCDMLREQCSVAVSPQKEEICAFFRQECLTTDTVFVDKSGVTTKPSAATSYQVVAKGKCIPYKEVKEFEKSTKKPIRAYEIDKKDTVYTYATTNATFPGGDEELVKYLSKNIRYPETAKRRNVQGTAYMKFIVRSDGRITDIRQVRSPDPELSNEALRVIQEMPKWTPATYKKNPVSMVYILPVKFKL